MPVEPVPVEPVPVEPVPVEPVPVEPEFCPEFDVVVPPFVAVTPLPGIRTVSEPTTTGGCCRATTVRAPPAPVATCRATGRTTAATASGRCGPARVVWSAVSPRSAAFSALREVPVHGSTAAGAAGATALCSATERLANGPRPAAVADRATTAPTPTTALASRAPRRRRAVPATGTATGAATTVGGLAGAPSSQEPSTTGISAVSGSGSARGPRAATAAPAATTILGSLSTATGRPSSAETICETSGIRDDPPTSRTAASSPGGVWACATARRSASTVSAIAGRIMSSNSVRHSRTMVCRPGSRTGIITSVSADRVSLAAVHSRRSPATAVCTAGSSGSRRSQASPSAARTCAKTASSKSTPPRRSMPVGRPWTANEPSGAFRTTAASKVPPPRS